MGIQIVDIEEIPQVQIDILKIGIILITIFGMT